MIAAPFLAACIAATGATPVRVPVEADASLPCAANGALRDALGTVAPAVRVVDSADEAELSAALRSDDGGWRLEIFEREGGVLLSRALPSAQDCGAVGAAAALIADHFVASRAQRSPPPPLDRLPRLAEERRFTSMLIGAGASLRRRGSEAPDLGGVLAVDVRLGSWGWAQAGGGQDLAQSVPVAIRGVERGTLTSTAFGGWLAGGGCLGDRPWSACAGPTVGLFGLRGEAEGTLFQQAPRTVMTVDLGVAARAGVRLGFGLDLSIGARVAAPLRPTAVQVEGTTARRESPAVDATVGLRLGWWIL